MYHFAIVNCDKSQIVVRKQGLYQRNICPIIYKDGEYSSVKIILERLAKIVNNYLFKIPQYSAPFSGRDNLLEIIHTKF